MELFEESLILWRELGDNQGVANALNGMGDALCDQGQFTHARPLYQEALTLAAEAGHKVTMAFVRGNLARLAHVDGDDVQALALLEDGLAWFREVGNKGALRWALWRLGEVVSDQGNIEGATRLLREAVVLNRQLGYKCNWSGSIMERFAGVLARQEQAESAARLFGHAEALRAAMGAPRPPSERAAYERDVAAARAQLDDGTFMTAWREGQGMSPEQAVAYALEVHT
jgi:tetratricopeptide (TPR) repeat protein